MLHQKLPWQTELDVCVALYRRRRAREIPRVWIDAGRVSIEIAGDPHRITWAQAQRIADGEPVHRVCSKAVEKEAAAQ